MDVSFFVLMFFGLLSQIGARSWLKRWGKRPVSIAANSVSIGLQADVVVNARNGDFMILPSNFKELNTSVHALFQQNVFQEDLERKVKAKEDTLRIVNSVFSVILIVMFMIILSMR